MADRMRSSDYQRHKDKEDTHFYFVKVKSTLLDFLVFTTFGLPLSVFFLGFAGSTFLRAFLAGPTFLVFHRLRFN